PCIDFCPPKYLPFVMRNLKKYFQKQRLADFYLELGLFCDKKDLLGGDLFRERGLHIYACHQGRMIFAGSKLIKSELICGNRLCPFCKQITRRNKFADYYYRLTKYKSIHPDVQLSFLTLTVQTCQELELALVKVKKNLKQLIRSVLW